MDPSNAVKRRKRLQDGGTSTCANRRSPPSITLAWLGLSIFSVPQRIATVLSSTFCSGSVAPRHKVFPSFSIHVYSCCVFLCVHSLSYGWPSFQIALTQKFRDAVSGSAVNISNLHVDTRYPVLHADCVETNYGQSILLTIRENEDNIKVFLPRRYSAVFPDEDFAVINGQALQYYLTYMGKSFSSNSYILKIDL